MDDVYFEDDDFVNYKGIKLPITRNMIFDMQSYGYDPMNCIIESYNNMKPYIRECKLKKLGII